MTFYLVGFTDSYSTIFSDESGNTTSECKYSITTRKKLKYIYFDDSDFQKISDSKVLTSKIPSQYSPEIDVNFLSIIKTENYPFEMGLFTISNDGTISVSVYDSKKNTGAITGWKNCKICWTTSGDNWEDVFIIN